MKKTHIQFPPFSFTPSFSLNIHLLIELHLKHVAEVFTFHSHVSQTKSSSEVTRSDLCSSDKVKLKI